MTGVGIDEVIEGIRTWLPRATASAGGRVAGVGVQGRAGCGGAEDRVGTDLQRDAGRADDGCGASRGRTDVRGAADRDRRVRRRRPATRWIGRGRSDRGAARAEEHPDRRPARRTDGAGRAAVRAADAGDRGECAGSGEVVPGVDAARRAGSADPGAEGRRDLRQPVRRGAEGGDRVVAGIGVRRRRHLQRDDADPCRAADRDRCRDARDAPRDRGRQGSGSGSHRFAEGIEYHLEVELGGLPRAFHTAIEETVRQTLHQGLFGWEILDSGWS